MCPPPIILHAAIINLRRASTFQIVAVTLKDTTIPGPSGKSKENAIDIKRALHEKLWSRIPRPIKRVCTTNVKKKKNTAILRIELQFNSEFLPNSTPPPPATSNQTSRTSSQGLEHRGSCKFPQTFRIPIQIQLTFLLGLHTYLQQDNSPLRNKKIARFHTLALSLHEQTPEKGKIISINQSINQFSN